MDPRAIIHLNVADFAVAVERILDPRLRLRPVIIAPQGGARATVYDMSEEAYRQGVRKAMPLYRARRRCPDAIILPPHTDRYERAMSTLLKHARPYSPLIERTDHKGHLFIDVTGTGRLFGPPRDVARRIRNHIRTDMGIAPIWSVAANKLVAKVATRIVKPEGEYIVPAGDEAVFLSPLPLHLIPGIRPTEIARFSDFNLTRAGQVATLTSAQLALLFGPRAGCLHEAVHGIDTSPVTPLGQREAAIQFSHEFADDVTDPEIVERILYRLCEYAGAHLRRRELAARRIGIFLDYADGKRSIRQSAVRPPCADDPHLFASARLALDRTWQRRVRIRHLRMVCDRLAPPSRQQYLFDTPPPETRERRELMKAIDQIRARFGFEAVTSGTFNAASST